MIFRPPCARSRPVPKIWSFRALAQSDSSCQGVELLGPQGIFQFSEILSLWIPSIFHYKYMALPKKTSVFLREAISFLLNHGVFEKRSMRTFLEAILKYYDFRTYIRNVPYVDWPHFAARGSGIDNTNNSNSSSNDTS